jgi:hypothetical protein
MENDTMEKKELMLAILIFLGLLSVDMRNVRAETSQFWNRETISGKMNDRLTVSCHTEYRFGDGLDNYFYQHTEFQLIYRINSWLSAVPAYRQVQSRPLHAAADEGRFLQHMPVLMLNGKYKWAAIGLSNRIRVERIFYEIDGERQWRFRNRFQIDFPRIGRKCQLQPILSEELFYLRQKDGFYRSRFTAGMNAVLSRNLLMTAFYRIEDDFRVHHWFPIYGLMVQFGF